MSCVEWGNLANGGKMKSKTEVYGKVVIHNGKDERLDHNHKNIHIDKDRTHLNFSCGGYTGYEVYELFLQRLAGVTVRNRDTVLLNSAIVYAPHGLENDVGLCSSWMMDVYRLAKERFGDNVLDMEVDFDEVHTYTVPKTKIERESLVHGHLRVFPELDGALNNNAVVTRAAIKGFNDDIERMTQEKYHVRWNTGEGKHPVNQTVEYLKNESLKAECEVLEARQEKAEELGDGLGLAVSVVNGTRRRIRKETARADDAEERRSKADAAARGAQAMLETIRATQAREIDAHEKAMNDGRKELEQLTSRRDRLASDCSALKDARMKLVSGLYGDLMDMDERKSAQGAKSLLTALGASMRPCMAPVPDVGLAVESGLEVAMKVHMSRDTSKDTSNTSTPPPVPVRVPPRVELMARIAAQVAEEYEEQDAAEQDAQADEDGLQKKIEKSL